MINPKTLEDLTLDKLTLFLKTLGCSNCKWNEAACDIHHVIERVNGGTDEFNNLAYICPNCHRLAHSGKLFNFITVDRQVGSDWLPFFDARRAEIITRYKEAAQLNKNISKHNAIRRDMRNAQSSEIVTKLRNANIDFQKYGWAKKAAPIVGIAPQKVRSWIKEFAPDLIEHSFKRSSPPGAIWQTRCPQKADVPGSNPGEGTNNDR